jgi:hypothetical protein
MRDTNTVLAARLKIDMSERIALLQPSATPFVTFLKRAQGNKEVATNPKFSWLEDDLGARWDAINAVAGFTDADTKLIVDHGEYFSVGDTVKVPRTGEVLLVTVINPDGDNTDEITVTRAFGTTTAAALVDNDPLVIIGNANQEGGASRTIKSTTEVEAYNYCQIFKTTFGLTNTAIATDMYGGPDLAYQQKKKGIEHMIDMARAFYFGQLKADVTGDHPRRATKGLLAFLTSNNYDASGALTKDEFDQGICEYVFLKGSKEKLALCSARVLSVINGWAESKLQTKQGDDTFGLAVTEYISPFGKLNLVHEPLFEGAVYGGYAAFIDVENVKYRPLKGRDTTLETNVQANDVDGRTDQYLTEAGLEVRLPATHALLTGVTS